MHVPSPGSVLPANRHRAFLLALIPAVVLRALAMAGYQPALWFWADSFSYLRAAADPVPGTFRPLGYSLFLAALAPGHSLALVTAVQHVLGVGLAVAVYVLLRRRGLPGWGATAVTMPLLYDEFLILLEHMIMADALFTVLVTAGVMALSRRAVTPLSAGAGGALLGLGAITRTVGVAVLVLAVVFALLRRTGWRPLAGLVLAGALPLVAYATWMYGTSGTFGLTRADGLFLWARTMTFADCSVIRPEPGLARLCPTTPVAARPAPAFWMWGAASPLAGTPRDRNALAGRFARAAIMAQPFDYLAAGAGDLGRLLRWERTTARSASMTKTKTNPYWFPFEERPLKQSTRAVAEAYEGGPAATRLTEPYAGWLRVYQRFGYLPFPLLVALLGGAVVLASVRRRPDALLPGLAAAALVLAPPFLTGFDVRYVVPAIPLTCMAAGLAAVGRTHAQDCRGPSVGSST
ncbi:hypothetical protein GCM10010412_046540 [Nonomuraea recticatena]|uniref:Glycosyltransferase RgtA/B/C/D-like domain-containing protein n=1 Tax=Nonomuraea recticatena TaxID=46178 RepID=A0ABN3S5G8_9ACTN